MTQLSSSSGPFDPWLERRLTAAAVIVLVAWGGLFGRLFYLQVVQGDRYQISAERNSVRTHRMAAPRGMILDRNREILVDSRPSFDVLVVPHETTDMAQTLERLASLLDLELEELVRSLGQPRGRQRFVPQRVAHDLGRDALARVEARLWALDGVLTQAGPIRSYPHGQSAAHLLGFLGETDREQLARREYQGYRAGDVVGRDGIERLLDLELRGRVGGRNVLVDAHGRELGSLDEAIEPQPGHNVVLTLDHRLQQVAEGALVAMQKRGAVVALDPRTGEVLVLASRPGFDPNLFAAGLDRAAWKALSEDSRTPLLNRALMGQYPPGSTYKVVTALAGLETGVISDDLRVTCTGSYRLGRRRYRCWRRGGHGTVDLHRALVESCDVYFYRVGQEVGVDRLAYYARALGLGSAAGIELREAPGLVPTRAWKLERRGERWQDGETLSVAIGQGFNLSTPMQLASAYAAIANGGVRYRPYVVSRVEDAAGGLILQSEPEVVGEVAVSKASLARVRDGLFGAVHEERGTGAVVRRLPGDIEAAGKTGTAQVVALGDDPPTDEEDLPEAHRDHAWFVGWAPAEDARIVVAVLVEHGGHGASAAAPIARDVLTAFFEHEAATGEADLHARN